MPTYTWVCFIVVVAGTEILERAHGFAAEWAAKCLSISTYLMLLMFSSVKVRLGHVTKELVDAIGRKDIPLIQHTATRLVLLGGEFVLLRFVACRLERAVSLFFFFCLERWLSALGM
jgi:hypothetical protein